MPVTNWTTDTVVNAQTGKTTVTVTVVDATSRPISVQWVSGAAAVPVSAVGPVSLPSANLGSAEVMAEANVAGLALLAAVNAGTAAIGVAVQANPDPTEVPPANPT